MKLLNDLSRHLCDINIEWHLCGGLAIDTYIGDLTREHKDLDITVSFKDMQKCIEYLSAKGWKIDAPVGNGRVVSVEYALANPQIYFDNIWCYKVGADFIEVEKTEGNFKYVKFCKRNQTQLDFLEVLFNHIENGIFHYKRNRSIIRETNKAFFLKDGVSILSPELVLLYKSTDCHNSDYKHDFHLTIDKLSEDSHSWLLTALHTAYPGGHPWIDEMGTHF